MIALAVLCGVCAGLAVPLAPRVADLMAGDRTLWTAVCCSTGLIFLMWSTWATGRVGESGRAVNGWDVPVLGWLVVTVAVALTVLSILRLVRGGGFDRVLFIGFGLVVVVALLSATVIEFIGPLLPVDLLPDSVRRAAFEVGSGEGLWAAVIIGCIGTVSTSGRLREALVPSVSFVSRGTFDPVALTLLGLLMACIVVFAVSRYMTWVTVSLRGEEHGVPGWALPFIGPLSLVGLLVSVAGLFLTLLRRAIWGVTLTATAALVVTLMASIFMLVSQELSDSGLVDGLARRLDLGESLVVVSTDSASMLQYAAALIGGLIQILFARRLATQGGR